MPLHDDNDRTAQIIKKLEQRVTDLEGGQGSNATPRVAPSARDEVAVDDSVTGVVRHTPQPATWDGTEAAGGWDIGTWS